MKTVTMMAVAGLVLAGCAHTGIDPAIEAYTLAARQVQLGDAKAQVLGVLEPTQVRLRPRLRKTPEKFLKDGVLVEIHYYRSGRQPDHMTTDDEFTPYVFNDGKLVAVGWTTLGGPRTHAVGHAS